MESWKFMLDNTNDTRQLANAIPVSRTPNQRPSIMSSFSTRFHEAKLIDSCINHARFSKWLGCCCTWTPNKNLEKSRTVYDNASIMSTVECSFTSSPSSKYYDASSQCNCNAYCSDEETVEVDSGAVNKVLDKGFEENCLPTAEEAAVDKHFNTIHEIKTCELIIAGRKSLKGLLKKDNESVHVSWEKGEIEWRRTLACKLFEERHNVSRSERMDSLWEAFEIDSNKKLHQTKNKTKKGKNKASNDDDKELDDEGHGQSCCLQAIKSSDAGKTKLVKLSKVLKGIRWLHYLTKHARK